jgi:CBS domain-containing protein
METEAQMKTPIQSGMTDDPMTITGDLTISDARETMRSWGMRHLPVVDDAGLVGVISDRDILRAFSLHKPGETEVKEVMTKSPYKVTPNVSVAEVATVLAENKFGSVIIVDDKNRVLGIFTTIDALRLLSRIMNEPGEVDYRAVLLGTYMAGLRRVA